MKISNLLTVQEISWLTESTTYQKTPFEFIAYGAVLGKEFDLKNAAILAGLNQERLTESTKELLSRNLVWIRDQQKCVFFHDKIRESTLARLEESKRQKIHLRVAEFVEGLRGNHVVDLAYHFDAAGEYERALGYALVSAEQARSEHSLQLAVQQFRIAERAHIKSMTRQDLKYSRVLDIRCCCSANTTKQKFN